jgi:hypothetical protein
VSSETQTYLFGPRERRGLILGLGRAQLSLIAAGLCGGISVMIAMPTILGVLIVIVELCITTLFAVLPVQGRSGPEWAPVVLGYLARPKSWRSRTPAAGISTDELLPTTIDLPRELADVRLLSARVDGQEIGVIFDGKGDNLRAVGHLRVTVTEPYSLLEPAEQDARVSWWGALLAGFADDDSPVDRLEVLEHTGPTDAGLLRRHFEMNLDETAPEEIINGIRERLADETSPTPTHDIVLSLRVNPSRCLDSIKANGQSVRGKVDDELGLVVTLAHEVRSYSEDLTGLPGLNVSPQLTGEQVADVLRTMYDPDERSRRAADSDDDDQLDPAQAWPLAVDEGWKWFRTDGGFAATHWVEQWPRRGVPADFMLPLFLRTKCSRTVKIVYAPVDDEKATRAAERAVTSEQSDSEFRDKMKQRETARQRNEAGVAVRREDALAEGHALMRVCGYVTVFGSDPDTLKANAAGVRRQARKSNLKLRLLVGEQAKAFTWGAIPLCRGVADKRLGGN